MIKDSGWVRRSLRDKCLSSVMINKGEEIIHLELGEIKVVEECMIITR